MKLIFIVLVMIFSTACEDSSLAESSDLHSDLLISRDATIERDLEIDKYIPVWDAEPDAEQETGQGLQGHWRLQSQALDRSPREGRRSIR